MFDEGEFDAATPVVGVLQAGKFADQVLQAVAALVGVFGGFHDVDALGDLIQEDVGHGFEGVGAAVVLHDLGGLFGEVIEPIEALLMEEPVLVAGASPFGEVLVGDGFAIEQFGEDFFGFREAVDPRQDVFAEFAVVEAAVELFPDVGGEAGDFA